jgi:hypothetical protein
MAHFAKLGVNGKVIAVHGLDNDKLLNADSVEDETVGQQELERIHGWPAAMWIKTSYNTRGNKYYNADGTEGDQANALRGNYAGIGYTWDEDNEIFWPKQPHASWSKNTTTAAWDAPITYPSVTNDGADPVVWNYNITWNETLYQSDNTKGWEANKLNVDGSAHADADKTYDWNGSAWVERA